jgi:putative oxidoreductase
MENKRRIVPVMLDPPSTSEGRFEMDKKTSPVLPVLTPLYTALEPFGYALMRLASGVIMATFGWGKLFGNGMARDIELFHRLGLEPAELLGRFTSSLEFYGGLLIAIGLLTRPIAAMLLGELLAILVMVIIPRGSGYQLTVVWVGVFFLILVHGGGRISVDRLLGREI